MALEEDTLKIMSLSAAILGSVILFTMIVAICVSLCHIFKVAKFRFILLLVLLMIGSDASLGSLAILFYFEGNLTERSKMITVSVAISIFTFFFNFCNVSLHWLFSMKYWMVAREVPRLFEAGRDIKFNEKNYKIANMVAITIITPVCVATAVYRGLLAWNSVGEKSASKSLVKTVQVLLWTVNLLELIATIVMIDALRRIQKSVKQNPFL